MNHSIFTIVRHAGALSRSAAIAARAARVPCFRAALLALAVVVLSACSTPARVYATPDAAVDALVGAMREKDKQEVRAIFGSGGDAIVSSGDPVEDRTGATNFLRVYDAQHRLVTNADGSVTLELGHESWPFPIPVVRQGDGWAFDCEAGEEEILNRRVGNNELATIQSCLALVDAQREYAHLDPDGNGLQEYAGKFVSDPGTRNGLYWPVKPGEPQSPLGPLVAEASDEGYSLAGVRTGEPMPYQGYRYRMLLSQGPHAPGGARDYVVRGHQIGGFACVASPVQYGNSGVMTFLVSQDGVVYERDLGADTAGVVRAMRSFNPGEGWKKVASADDA